MLVSPRVDVPLEAEHVEDGVEAEEGDPRVLRLLRNLLLDPEALFNQLLVELALVDAQAALEEEAGEPVDAGVGLDGRDELGRLQAAGLLEDGAVVEDAGVRQDLLLGALVGRLFEGADEGVVDLHLPVFTDDHEGQVVQFAGHVVAVVGAEEALDEVLLEVAEAVDGEHGQAEEGGQATHVVGGHEDVNFVVVGGGVGAGGEVDEVEGEVEEVEFDGDDDEGADEEEVRVGC